MLVIKLKHCFRDEASTFFNALNITNSVHQIYFVSSEATEKNLPCDIAIITVWGEEDRLNTLIQSLKTLNCDFDFEFNENKSVISFRQTEVKPIVRPLDDYMQSVENENRLSTNVYNVAHDFNGREFLDFKSQTRANFDVIQKTLVDLKAFEEQILEGQKKLGVFPATPNMAHRLSNFGDSSQSNQSGDVSITGAYGDQQATPRQFKAKNELVARGLSCQVCQLKMTGDTVNALVKNAEIHCLDHFNEENPTLKRFQCKDCPNISTNFVKTIEDHLKRHGSMMSMPQRRSSFLMEELTPEYLKVLAAIANRSFPEIFEKAPPPRDSLEKYATPQRALQQVFPAIKGTFKQAYNVRTFS